MEREGAGSFFFFFFFQYGTDSMLSNIVPQWRLLHINDGANAPWKK